MLAQEAFKLLAAFLRTCPSYQPSTPQVGARLPPVTHALCMSSPLACMLALHLYATSLVRESLVSYDSHSFTWMLSMSSDEMDTGLGCSPSLSLTGQVHVQLLLVQTWHVCSHHGCCARDAALLPQVPESCGSCVFCMPVRLSAVRAQAATCQCSYGG